MPVDYKNPTESDFRWMEAMNNAQSVVLSRPDLPHFEGVMVFTRFLDDFTEPETWDGGNEKLRLLTTDGPDRLNMKNRVTALANEAKDWMRDVIDARYAKDAEIGTPTPQETRDFIETQYARQVDIFLKPDFFETEVSPILSAFYTDRLKYSAHAFALSAMLGISLQQAQTVIDRSGIADVLISDEGKDFSFES